MNLRVKKDLVWIAAALAFVGASMKGAGAAPPPGSRFYSSEGREHAVAYESVLRTRYTDVDQFKKMSAAARKAFIRTELEPVFQFQFGPLTHREVGGPLRSTGVKVSWSSARLISGRVEVPYEYRGVWLIRKDIANGRGLTIPVPRNVEDLFTNQWKSCTDSDPEHQTPSFFWYFWDPARRGCDHAQGSEYDEVVIRIGPQTTNEPRTYPEYDRLFRTKNAEKSLTLTFGFGYVQDPARPNPERDRDAGMAEYRNFVQTVRQLLRANAPKETPILQAEYPEATDPRLQIGHRFQARVSDAEVTINVVAAAGVDQMVIFAKSFAHDHDGFFAWLGHSRVGTGFDAQRFGAMLRSDPSYYSISSQYQVIYWGGCNSYSYYTLPFFEFKGGTRNLDILANGLPSLFAFNSMNAATVLTAFLNWESRPSYQEIVDKIEADAAHWGVTVLTAVLGDEDNPR